MEQDADSPNESTETGDDLDAKALNDASWEFVDQMVQHGFSMDGPMFNNTKAMIRATILKYQESRRLSRSDGATTATPLTQK